MPLTFSNPRILAEFNDWPSGSKRVKCVFHVERHPKRGDRVGRTTTGKTKYTTYGGLAAIVDGSDGKTYILTCAPAAYGQSVSVHRSDFMCADEAMGGNGKHYVPFADERYSELLALIAQANEGKEPPAAK